MIDSVDDAVGAAITSGTVGPTALEYLLIRHGLPTATFHVVIAGHEVDFLIDGTNIVLECDGWEWHGRTRAQFERDRARGLELGARGYIVFRFTWLSITRHAGRTATRIRELIAMWAPEVLAAPPSCAPDGSPAP